MVALDIRVGVPEMVVMVGAFVRSLVAIASDVDAEHSDRGLG
jgi:hypothetical protein